ncbi:MAG: glycosyltransferase family 4 protein [Lentimonas sp.]
MRRVTHILGSHREIGGLEKYVKDLSIAQVGAGMHVSVCAHARMKGLFPAGVNFYALNMGLSRLDPRLLWKLWIALKESQPDLVHVHANKAARGSALLKKWANCPFVATVHGVKKRTGVYGHFDRVIVPSRIVADTLTGVRSDIVYNAVSSYNPEWMKQAMRLNPPFRDNENQLILYAAGRFAKVKGYDLLLGAVARLPQACLWLVGDGPEMQNLKQMVHLLGIADRVWMPGYLPESQMIGLMPLSSLFVICSRKEAGPFTLAQALRAQCPVISTRVGIAEEFLGDQQLLDGVSSDAIVKGIEFFLRAPEEYLDSIAPAFRLADERLEFSKMVQRVNDIYEAALLDRGAD